MVRFLWLYGVFLIAWHISHPCEIQLRAEWRNQQASQQVQVDQRWVLAEPDIVSIFKLQILMQFVVDDLLSAQAFRFCWNKSMTDAAGPDRFWITHEASHVLITLGAHTSQLPSAHLATVAISECIVNEHAKVFSHHPPLIQCLDCQENL